ncbi:MAG: hypothetical protein R3251_04120 [Candidatus Spechtbacterales bacterium]|nr:hypothetical protein [Candidatus Spechtbacterales bacterium]
MEKTEHQKEAQKFQDNIFRKMTANEKIELASGMWHLANNLKNVNKNEQKGRSKRSSKRYIKNS